jgi:hypothetical protein
MTLAAVVEPAEVEVDAGIGSNGSFDGLVVTRS